MTIQKKIGITSWVSCRSYIGEKVENRPTLQARRARLPRVRPSGGVSLEPDTLPVSTSRPSPGPHRPSRPAQPLEIPSSATGFHPGSSPSSASRARIESASPAGGAWQSRAFIWASYGTHPSRLRRRVRAPRSFPGGMGVDFSRNRGPRGTLRTRATQAEPRDPALGFSRGTVVLGWNLRATPAAYPADARSCAGRGSNLVDFRLGASLGSPGSKLWGPPPRPEGVPAGCTVYHRVGLEPTNPGRGQPCLSLTVRPSYPLKREKSLIAISGLTERRRPPKLYIKKKIAQDPETHRIPPLGP
jgi:hypothetical protein